MQMWDRVKVGSADIRMTNDGYLVAVPRVARTGIQIYGGKEVGMPQKDTVRVYRPEDEVFNTDSMQTFAYRPITDDHPPERVTADNWRKYSAGQSGGEVARDGEFLRVPMVVMDAVSIKKFNDGKAELSVGYTTDLKWGAGVTPGGEAYDAIQTSIRANHIAIVGEARGGPKLRIGDAEDPGSLITPDSAGNHEEPDMGEKSTTVVVDSISLEMSDTAAAVVQRALKAANDQIATLTAKVTKDAEETAEEKKKREAEQAKEKTDHATAIAAKDAEIATLKKQVADSALTPDKLSKLVADRTEVFGKAKSILGDKLVSDGKTEAEVRRQVVDAKLGETAKGWTDDQVTISFDTLTAGVKIGTSNVADTAAAFNGGQPHQPGTPMSQDKKNAMYAESDKKLTEKWKTPGKAA